jgi:hypothetical protein
MTCVYASGKQEVHCSGKRWKSTICYGGKRHHFGYFATRQEAAFAYDRTAREHAKKTPMNYESTTAAEEALKASAQEQRKHGGRGELRSTTAARSTASVPSIPTRRPHSHIIRQGSKETEL